jgi:heavy metal sensor kinase
MRLPIRLRLTLVFGLAMAVLLVAGGTFLYQRLAAELRSATDASLRSQADVLVSGIGQGEMAFGDTTGAAIQEGQPFAQILTRDGRIVESNEPLAHTPLLGPVEARAANAPSFLQREVPGVEGTSLLYAVPVANGTRHLVVVVGASLSNRQEILARFLLLLVIGGPLGLLVASGIAWLIAGAALRPVESMREEASAISVSDRGRRLPVPSTGDEIARLGVTLNSMLDRLQQAFDRERRFVDDASHELRTPIAILRAELDLVLSRSRTPHEIEAALRSAIEEADRLSALANNLLVYSRADGAHVPLDRRPLRVDALVAEICTTFCSRADAADIAMTVDAPELTAWLDEARLRQALTNVIDNALRHTPAGGRIRIAVRSEGDEVRVTVEDTGTGFDTDLVPGAFEPFSRGTAERASAEPGAGLGLAIVQAVAEAHGGRAVAENRTDGGARLTLILRARDAVDSS